MKNKNHAATHPIQRNSEGDMLVWWRTRENAATKLPASKHMSVSEMKNHWVFDKSLFAMGAMTSPLLAAVAFLFGSVAAAILLGPGVSEGNLSGVFEGNLFELNPVNTTAAGLAFACPWVAELFTKHPLQEREFMSDGHIYGDLLGTYALCSREKMDVSHDGSSGLRVWHEENSDSPLALSALHQHQTECDCHRSWHTYEQIRPEGGEKISVVIRSGKDCYVVDSDLHDALASYLEETPEDDVDLELLEALSAYMERVNKGVQARVIDKVKPGSEIVQKRIDELEAELREERAHLISGFREAQERMSYLFEEHKKIERDEHDQRILSMLD